MSVPELEDHRKRFEQIKVQAKEVTEGLNEARFNWRPSPVAWSIEECLGHLIIIGNFMIQGIETAIDDAKAHGLTGSGPFRYGFLERLIVRQTEPPVHRKFKSPRRFRPLHLQPVTAILPSFLHLQSQLILQLERAGGLDLARVKVPTPVPLLKISLGMAFAMTASHEARHMQQAQRVRQQLETV